MAKINQEWPVSTQKWVDCPKWISHHNLISLPSSQITSVCQFLYSLIANERDLVALETITEHDIALNVIFPLDQHQEDTFSILPNKLYDRSLSYIIDNNDTHTSNQWSLILTDPVTILQCMCMNFNVSLNDMACYLHYSGIHFHTCILHDLAESDDALPYQPLSLGWCPSEHKSKPTTGDYREYHVTLDHLSSRPYARGAVAVPVAVTGFGLGFPMYIPIPQSYHHLIYLISHLSNSSMFSPLFLKVGLFGALHCHTLEIASLMSPMDHPLMQHH